MAAIDAARSDTGGELGRVDQSARLVGASTHDQPLLAMHIDRRLSPSAFRDRARSHVGRSIFLAEVVTTRRSALIVKLSRSYIGERDVAWDNRYSRLTCNSTRQRYTALDGDTLSSPQSGTSAPGSRSATAAATGTVAIWRTASRGVASGTERNGTIRLRMPPVITGAGACSTGRMTDGRALLVVGRAVVGSLTGWGSFRC